MTQANLRTPQLSLFDLPRTGRKRGPAPTLWNEDESGGSRDASKYVSTPCEGCPFIDRIGHLLARKMTPAEVRDARGTFVYLVVAPNLIAYAKGRSPVKYIGFTGNAKRRHAGHDKIADGDRVLLVDLRPHLRSIKARDRNGWNSKTREEQERFAKQAEAAFLLGFEQLLGQLPQENDKHETLTLDGRFLTSILFGCRRR